jgi:hypothetical protein
MATWPTIPIGAGVTYNRLGKPGTVIAGGMDDIYVVRLALTNRSTIDRSLHVSDLTVHEAPLDPPAGDVDWSGGASGYAQQAADHAEAGR